MTYEIMTHRYTPTDPRLGRHVHHDSRSAMYAHGVMPKDAIKSVTWARHIPILNQGQLGSCVPNNEPEFEGTDALGYTGVTSVTIPKADTKGMFKAGSLWNLDEDFAVNMYRLVTRIDPYAGQWEPTDTGSDGLSLAKAMVMLGLADKYTHAFTYAAAVSALMTGPVTFGMRWYNSMFETGADGRITVDTSSGLAGGHQIFSRQYDVDNDRVWVDNSWGPDDFGLDGRGYFTGADLTRLLKTDGDVTVPHLVAAAPVPPAPPAPVVIGSQDFYNAIKTVATAGGLV
jgi:hypothetical protein